MASISGLDWYLPQWLHSLRVTQAKLGRLTGWDKRKCSHLVTGKQPYTREIVNEASAALNIEPFELLMHPDDAFALRRLRDTAIRIAADVRVPFTETTIETPSRQQSG